MTSNCIKTLKQLRKNNKFDDLSLEQLLYEALKGSNWNRVELVHLIDELIKERNKLEELER